MVNVNRTIDGTLKRKNIPLLQLFACMKLDFIFKELQFRSFIFKKNIPKMLQMLHVQAQVKKKRLFLRDNKHFYNRASRNAEMPHFRNFPRSYAEKFK